MMQSCPGAMLIKQNTRDKLSIDFDRQKYLQRPTKYKVLLKSTMYRY